MEIPGGTFRTYDFFVISHVHKSKAKVGQKLTEAVSMLKGFIRDNTTTEHVHC